MHTLRSTVGVAASLLLSATMAACSSGVSESPDESRTSVGPSTAASQPASSQSASDQPTSQASNAPSQDAASDPYHLPEGSWTGGELHLEVTGGAVATLDLPLVSGTTSAGMTSLVYENQTDETYSIGSVRLSLVIEADGISITAGELTVLGPCEYAWSEVRVGGLAGELTCAEDLQALVQGDPREVTVTGTFTAS